MKALRVSRLVALTLAVGVVLLISGCGDDEPTGGNGDTLFGSWIATSLTAPSQPGWGDGVVDDGLSISMTFNDTGSYSGSASNDDPADPWICENTASCAWSGSYSTSGNTVVFDEGTPDELSATYSISGNTLTLTFSATAGNTDPYRYVLRRS